MEVATDTFSKFFMPSIGRQKYNFQLKSMPYICISLSIHRLLVDVCLRYQFFTGLFIPIPTKWQLKTSWSCKELCISKYCPTFVVKHPQILDPKVKLIKRRQFERHNRRKKCHNVIKKMKRRAVIQAKIMATNNINVF